MEDTRDTLRSREEVSMPEVSFSPINQCTIDDPSDGVEVQTVVPESGRGPTLKPPCQPAVPGAGGRSGDECTDELVRRFSGEGGAPLTAETSSAPAASHSCLGEELRAFAACGVAVRASGDDQSLPVFQIATCVGALVSVAECFIAGDGPAR
jgi:hypothetical protein